MEAEMKSNCELACVAGAALRVVVPQFKFYVPAEHEEFVSLAYHGCVLNELQIVGIDTEIQDRCCATLFFNHQRSFSSGMLTEWHNVKYADTHPVMTFSSLEQIPNSVKAFLEILQCS